MFQGVSWLGLSVDQLERFRPYLDYVLSFEPSTFFLEIFKTYLLATLFIFGFSFVF
jgi:hypothetical protein